MKKQLMNAWGYQLPGAKITISFLNFISKLLSKYCLQEFDKY